MHILLHKWISQILRCDQMRRPFPANSINDSTCVTGHVSIYKKKSPDLIQFVSDDITEFYTSINFDKIISKSYNHFIV